MTGFRTRGWHTARANKLSVQQFDEYLREEYGSNATNAMSSEAKTALEVNDPKDKEASYHRMSTLDFMRLPFEASEAQLS